ncbi:xaa-Pro dipeptidase [Chrysoperla carnea]|uniref:xaa-Pro dipeptidase n=1 Tax=Chrysoperla carnea TaxID=189513 RepID=UPI001D07421E|nr:xaa-Pro dipeptidase [Chrysoperla carnea]
MATNMFRANGKSFYWMGNETHKVPMALYSENRQRLVQRLKGNLRTPADAYIFLEGGKNVSLYDTDVDYNVFRQEPYFMWTFGVPLPDCIGLVEVASGNPYLFVPRYPEEYGIWMGSPPKAEDFKDAFGIDNVYYMDELEAFLDKLPSVTLLTLNGKNSDSGLTTPKITWDKLLRYKIKDDLLYYEITQCRVIKNKYEIEVLRYVAAVSVEAHKRVMHYVKPGVYEYQCESEFLNYCYQNGGCRHVSYTCICGSGHNSSILHYGHEGAPNNKAIENGEMCLFDMGANYCGYAADITCSYPANGKFTEDQKAIYNAVLDASRAVINALKPGQSWVAMHKLANRVMLTKLKEIGILVGEVEHMLQAELAAFFQPHGLGHFIGLDVHDVGGYLTGHPPRPTERSLKSLRTARTIEKGMYVTVEPGCYFIDTLLDEALSNEKLSVFFNKEVLQRFRGFGGVRIEDDILITEEGCEIFSCNLPRTVAEIEAFMKSKLASN